MLPLLIGSGLLGLYETIKGQSDLNDLHKQPVPKFGETPEQAASRVRAESMSSYGYSPQERASFRNNVAENINTQSQKALDLGGGSLAKVISGFGKMGELDSENKFAAGDAALHRQNIHYADKFSQQLQNLSNMNVQAQLKQRLLAEQALGGAVKTGLSGLASTANLAQILGSGAGKDKLDVLKLLGGGKADGSATGSDFSNEDFSSFT